MKNNKIQPFTIGTMHRVSYIDSFKGICMIWIIWFHTQHPGFVEYNFFIPSLFVMSGIFYKQYSWAIFWRKKINTLVVPFLFFYLIYYIFLLIINYKDISIVYTHILDVFGLYKGREGFVVNYPLWFICSLLVMQFWVYAIRKLSSSDYFLLLTAILLTVIGNVFLTNISSPFMIFQSTKYILYFVSGFVFGKQFIYYLEQRKISLLFIFILFIIQIVLWMFLQYIAPLVAVLLEKLHYILFTFIVLYFLKGISKTQLNVFFAYIGRNSIVIFGLHELCLTILTIIYTHTIGPLNVYVGLIFVVLTILIMIPCINYLNQRLPIFIGKKEFLSIC